LISPKPKDSEKIETLEDPIITMSKTIDIRQTLENLEATEAKFEDNQRVQR